MVQQARDIGKAQRDAHARELPVLSHLSRNNQNTTGGGAREPRLRRAPRGK
jgi:hypothetical protein